MKEPITTELFDEWELSTKTCGRLEDKIINRITYIIETFFKLYDQTLDTWYFEDAKEGKLGDLSCHIWEDTISGIEVEADGKSGNMSFIDKDDKECCWDGSIPVRWLFEDFEKEIVEGKKLFEEKDAARKAKKKATAEKRKAEKKALAASAKAKLSKEELKAIKSSL